MNAKTLTMTMALAYGSAADAGSTADALGFVGGSMLIEVFGSDSQHDHGDIDIFEPVDSFSLYVETDQGFAEVSGSVLVGGGVSRFVLDGTSSAQSSVWFSFLLFVVEDTTYEVLGANSGDVTFEAVSGSLDPAQGLISAGTYRVEATYGDWSFYALDWALQIDGEFAVVPAPASAGLVVAVGLMGGRRRRQPAGGGAQGRR